MTQFARPTSDISTGSWTTTPLWSKIDEGSPGNGDVITSEAVGNNVDTSTIEVQLNSVSDPGVSSGHVIRARLRDNDASRTMSATIELVEGSTVRATLSVAVTPDTLGLQTYTLSAAEADAITNYADLRIRVHGRGTSGGPSRSLEIDFVELETPDAAAPSQTVEAQTILVTPQAFDAKANHVVKSPQISQAPVLSQPVIAPGGVIVVSNPAPVIPQLFDPSIPQIIKALFIGGAYKDAVLALSPAAFWPLHDSSGSTVAEDLGPGEVDGTYFDNGGGTGPTPGVAGVVADGATAAQWFDDGDEVFIPNTAPIDIREALTVALWVRKSTAWSGNSRLFEQGLDNQYRIYHQSFGTVGSRLVFRLFGTAAGISKADERLVNDGDPHFIVGTYDGSNIRIYIDAVEGGGSPVAATGLIGAGTNQAGAIGNKPGSVGTNDSFNGVIGMVAVFDYALTPQQIQDLYDAGISGVGATSLFSPKAVHHVQPPLVDNLASTFSPEVISIQPVLTNLLNNPPVVFNHLVSQLVRADLITHGNILYTPTISPGEVSVVAQLITNAPTLYNANLTVGTTISVDDLLNAAEVLSPDISQRVNAELLNRQVEVFSPQVTQLIVLQLITNTGQVTTPQVSQSVAMQLLGNLATLFDPQIAQRILVELIAINPALFDPAITVGTTVLVPILDNEPQLHDPSITTVATIVSDLLTQGVSVQTPEIRTGTVIVASELENIPILLNPTITAVARVIMELLDNGSVVLNPAILATNLVDVGALDRVTDALSPEVIRGSVVVQAESLNNGPLVYPVGIIGDQLVLALVIDNSADVNNPSVFLGVVPTTYKWNSQNSMPGSVEFIQTGQDELRRN